MKATTDSSDVQQFFAGCSIFLTGATSFLGKLLLEKTLRSTEVRRIYILLKSKDDQCAQERLAELLDSQIFHPVKRENADFASKVSFVEGDCFKPDFGLSATDLKMVTEDVDCIFHCADNSSPDQKLSSAIKINVHSVANILAMAKQIKRLKALVIPSSVFCHGKRVEEVFYGCDYKPNELIAAATNLDDDLLDVLTEKFLKSSPNTHVFTKAISEELIRTEGKGLPIAIVRHSFVSATAEEPITGYVENNFSPTPLLSDISLGLIKTFPGNNKLICDLIPSDFVVNNMLVAAWDIANTQRTSGEDGAKEAAIFNCVSSVDNPITWDELQEKFSISYMRHPSKFAMWYPLGTATLCIYNYLVLAFLFHTIPAYFGHYLGMCLGKNCKSIEAFGKIANYLDILKYYTMNEFRFSNRNNIDLYNKMSFKDKKLFNFDVTTLNWDTFIEFYSKGIRVYILKDSMDSVSEGLKKFQRLKIVNYFAVTILVIFCYFLVRCSILFLFRRLF